MHLHARAAFCMPAISLSRDVHYYSSQQVPCSFYFHTFVRENAKSVNNLHCLIRIQENINFLFIIFI